MFELTIRLFAAGAAVLLTGWLGTPDFGVASKVAALVGAYALLGLFMERRDLKNAGVAGFFAVADAGAIAALVGSAGQLDTLGFLALAPIAYAAARYGSLPSAMAPLAAGAVFLSHAVFEKGQPSPVLYAQTLGILLVGLLLNHRRIVVTVTRDVVGPVAPMERQEPDGFLALRENFRKLKDMYRELDRKSRRDRLAVQLLEARLPDGERFHNKLADRLRELLGVEGLSLYTLAQMEEAMIVRARSGQIPVGISEAAVQVDMDLAPGQIRHNAQKLLATYLTEERRSRVSSVLLTHRGQVNGMLCLVNENALRLDEAVTSAEEVATLVGALIEEERERCSQERRLRETEILYETAVVSSGAVTPGRLAARLTRELKELVPADHLGIYWLDGTQAIPASVEGFRQRLVDVMSFADGPGVGGWLGIGAPEVVMFQTLDDLRCTPEEALKLRIGSYALFPIQFGEQPYGFLSAATHNGGGLDKPDIETLRAVTAELSRAVGRLVAGEEQTEGVVSPIEFQQTVSEDPRGCLVYVEPLKKERIVEVFGRPAYDHALRQLGRKVRGKLPKGGALCRRSEGDFVAYLRGVSDSFAASWANDVAAHASMIPITTPDGTARIPFAVRVKVANLSQQSNEFSTANSA